MHYSAALPYVQAKQYSRFSELRKLGIDRLHCSGDELSERNLAIIYYGEFSLEVLHR